MSNQILDKLRKKFSQKKVYIIGLGLQGGGVGLVNFFTDLGARVTVTDQKTHHQLASSLKQINNPDTEFLLGEDYLKNILQGDFIIKGPSVPWNIPELIQAGQNKIPIDMEMSFFAEYCPAKIIGITGTRGKSTTTMMVYGLLGKYSGKKTYLGGNIPGLSTIALLKEITIDDLVVLELPSWPLSGFHQKKISPHIAVFTNFYPDHLNYYENLENYLNDKKAIYQYQKNTDYLIINQSLKQIVEKNSSQAKILYFDKKSFPGKLKYLKGDHNQENASAAFTVSKIFNLNQEDSIDYLSNFRTLPYRQEIIRIINNVTFVNDTTATTPTAVIKALEAFSDQPIILILGNTAKGLPIDELLTKLSLPAGIVMIKGSFADQLTPFITKAYKGKTTRIFADLRDAVETAYKLARQLKTQSYVILSPGGSSFEMFTNEFDRGNRFNQIVSSL